MMNLLNVLFISLSLIQICHTELPSSIQFIKSFIVNERKPTCLVFHGLCWDKRLQVILSIEIAKIGGKSSGAFDVRSKYQDNNLLFLIDLDCHNSEELITNASRQNLFRSPYRWLMLGSSLEDRKLLTLNQTPLLADSDLVLAHREGDTSRRNMNEVYKPSLHGDIVYTPRGHFNGTIIDIREHRELYRRRRDLKGYALTMSNVIQDSNTTQYHLPRENRLEPQNDIIAKICWTNAKLAFEMLNATSKYIFSYRWGYKVNGQWSGMINDLYTSKADLGTNCVVFDIARLDVVTFTDCLAPFRVRFIYRQPPLAYVSNIFSLPFSGNVWMAAGFCVVMSTVTVYLASKSEASIEKGPARLDGSLGDAVLLTMSAVSQQGCAMEPSRASGRIMLMVTFTALMALYAAYAANIVVLLQAPSNSIRSLSQLAASKITLAAYDVDYNHFIFQLYKDPVHVAIYKRIQPNKGKGQFYSLNEGVERIREGLFAFHSIVEPVYRRIEDTFLESEKCDLTEVNFLSSFDPFVPVKKDSPYLELLKVAFKRIRESGIQAAVNKRYQVPKPRCLHKVSAFSSVGLLDMQPVLLLMLYGIALSLSIAVIEIIEFNIM